MAAGISREDVQRLRAEGAQVVEVLPEEEYRQSHIAGAISLPLTVLNEETAARLDRNQPVVTYCYDFQCDLSPRAAARLESLGFTRVYDYEGGKMDWLAFGLPAEGESEGEPTAGGLARRDAPTCGLDDRLGDLSRRLPAGWTWCAVLDQDGRVLGRVRRHQVDERPGARANEVMDEGPSTYRPSLPAAELVEAMKQGQFEQAFVTDSDGRFFGLVRRQELEAALAR